MEKTNMNKKFIYEPGQYEVKVSQCKDCDKQTKKGSCALYSQIPLSVLTNKETCELKAKQGV